ncbi:MAG: hypothetical protein IJ496_07935 [Ruminococcus sp.]|nr:hypothetical protein [Ruminococcus sp.]
MDVQSRPGLNADEMHCISVGYPIETGAEGSPGDAGFVVEYTAGEQVYISQPEAVLWTKYLISGICSSSPERMQLCRKGLMILSQNKYQLLYHLSALKPIRQGMGVHVRKENNKTDVTFQIYIGKESYILSRLQRVLWSQADGVSTLSQILDKNRAQHSCSEDEIFEAIRGLTGCGLMFFRR